LSTPSIGPRYGFPLLKIIISRNIYRMGTLIVMSISAYNLFKWCIILNHHETRNNSFIPVFYRRYCTGNIPLKYVRTA
jgi:hypothetical protein